MAGKHCNFYLSEDCLNKISRIMSNKKVNYRKRSHIIEDGVFMLYNKIRLDGNEI
jgi:hypothetical protein